MTVTVPLAIACYLWIEQPGIALGRRFTARRFDAPMCLTAMRAMQPSRTIAQTLERRLRLDGRMEVKCHRCESRRHHPARMHPLPAGNADMKARGIIEGLPPVEAALLV
jgi:hypothetical protein